MWVVSLYQVLLLCTDILLFYIQASCIPNFDSYRGALEMMMRLLFDRSKCVTSQSM